MSYCSRCAEYESRIAALTAELRQMRCLKNECLADKEAAEAEVARLREELQKAERIWVIDRDARSADERALATERAAREKAEAKAAEERRNFDCAWLDIERWTERCLQAERERDTALADAQLAHAAALEQHGSCFAQIESWKARALAAESALASARPYVQHALAYLTDKDDVESTPLHAIGHAVAELHKLDETLSSAPSPAPCSGCEELKAKLERALEALEPWAYKGAYKGGPIQRALEALR